LGIWYKVFVKKSDPFVEDLKSLLGEHLNQQGINATNFAIHSHIALWREIYEKDFHVKPKTYRSSVEALLKRVVTGKEIWNICNVVDLYNCSSVLSLLPMGGYDLNKVSGDITIRYAKESETFTSLGEWQPTPTQTNHVVYADDKRLMCWLWNYKDCAETCIDEHSENVIFFIDAFEHDKVQEALKLLAGNLKGIQCTPLDSGILNKSLPQVNLEICSVR
jgi:lysyl-tRNA synthetase class 2